MEIKTQRLVIRELSSANMKEFRETCNDTTSITDYLTPKVSLTAQSSFIKKE